MLSYCCHCFCCCYTCRCISRARFARFFSNFFYCFSITALATAAVAVAVIVSTAAICMLPFLCCLHFLFTYLSHLNPQHPFCCSNIGINTKRQRAASTQAILTTAATTTVAIVTSSSINLVNFTRISHHESIRLESFSHRCFPLLSDFVCFLLCTAFLGLFILYVCCFIVC